LYFNNESYYFSNLAGHYGDITHKGVIWKDFGGYSKSMRRATMMIRPKTN